jgi:hypothetical protein
MARVFTTSFEFNHQRYQAIVTILSKGDQLNFNVRLLDPELHEIIPEGVIDYLGANGYEKMDNIRNNFAQSLINKVGEAVNNHLLKTS